MYSELFINTDGGARGNPGPSGIGVVYTLGEEVTSFGKYIGTATNNVAEYTGLLEALQAVHSFLASHAGVQKITIRMDSELIVKQLTGVYRIKDANLQQLAMQVRAELASLAIPYSFQHVLRAQNKLADAEVNKALDLHMGK